MYIIGHCITAERSRCFADHEIYGDTCLQLMIPDVARCHDWGYQRQFDPLPDSLDQKLLRAHIAADWWIHFGPSTARARRGWAYRRMAIFARYYSRFFAQSTRMGVRSDSEPIDSVRGFAHTMMEYSIDTWLAKNVLSVERFHIIKQALSWKNGGNVTRIQSILDNLGVSEPSSDLASDVMSFGTRVDASSCPEEFAYRAGVKKFGLFDNDSAIALVEQTIHDGMRELEDGEIPAVVDQVSAFVRLQLESQAFPG